MLHDDDIEQIKQFQSSFNQRKSVKPIIDAIENVKCDDESSEVCVLLNKIKAELKSIHFEGFSLTSQYVKAFHDLIPRLSDPEYKPTNAFEMPNHVSIRERGPWVSLKTTTS